MTCFVGVGRQQGGDLLSKVCGEGGDLFVGGVVEGEELEEDASERPHVRLVEG